MFFNILCSSPLYVLSHSLTGFFDSFCVVGIILIHLITVCFINCITKSPVFLPGILYRLRGEAFVVRSAPAGSRSIPDRVGDVISNHQWNIRIRTCGSVLRLTLPPIWEDVPATVFWDLRPCMASYRRYRLILWISCRQSSAS